MYFVLGGRGFVGSAVCRLLAARGIPNVAIGRGEYDRWLGRSCGVLVNCAGNPRRYWANEHPYEDFVATVALTARSLVDFRAELYVQISSVDVYDSTDDPARTREDAPVRPERLSSYGLNKWLAELLVRRYAAAWLILRLGGLVGQGLKKNPVFDALTGAPLRLTRDSALGFIDVDDVADALHRLVTSGARNEVFNVCGTGVITVDELAALSPRPVRFLEPGERQRYDVSNEKLRRLMPIRSSREAVSAFFARHASSSPSGGRIS